MQEGKTASRLTMEAPAAEAAAAAAVDWKGYQFCSHAIYWHSVMVYGSIVNVFAIHFILLGEKKLLMLNLNGLTHTLVPVS